MKKLLLGIVAACMATPMVAQDPATYQPVNGYSIENLWIQSLQTGNNMPEITGGNVTRGMAVKGDEVLFSYRGDFTGIKVFDLKTGAKKRDIKFDTEKFKINYYRTDTTIVGTDTTYTQVLAEKSAPGYLANDIQVDDAGNVLTFNMTTDLKTDQVGIWKIDMATGEPTKVMELTNVEGLLDSYRIDYFAVKGDVTKDAIVMFPVSSKNLAIRCDIKDGQLVEQTGDYAGYKFKEITIQKYSPESAVDNSYGPRIAIIDNDYFYLDGFSSEAALYDMSGSLIESVSDAPEECGIVNSKFGNNGVAEFTLNNKPFCIYVVSNNETTPPQAWKIIEMGEGPTFEGATYYWTIPENGLGTASNAVRTALPRIAKVTDGNGLEAAYIAVFACESGAAVYKMTPDGYDEDSESGVARVAADNVKVFVNGDMIQFSGAADATVYNLAGQKVMEANGVESMAAPAVKGIYVVKAVVDGVQKVQKVVVK
ncbi:hypothetical protein NW211_05100 [Barnesiella sp. ET7]|uniref:hypothetical protein n=1 Tax=Barnesiella sp. ET7 TaxID=2972460 RepID=UPI0021AC791F|nr:hypothetical protein [Barnesiella sp. ET7]MCR8911376.1 hypothetical protein [Barnesiella sp. ET7]